MTFYAGLDIEQYPGLGVMNWLNSNTNLRWCGYYLAPAPNRPPSGWTGQYANLVGKWGVLPIYVGQQDPRTATSSYTPSSILTTGQGTIDGGNAADLAAADGFPHGTVVYLDWEYGGLDGGGSSDYIKAWITAVVADGRIAPGIYCSHVTAQAVADVIDSINPTPNTRFWCWRVSIATNHPFTGDLSQLPEVDPTGCGFQGAQVWQREQNAVVTFPAGAPVNSMTMDFSTSSLPDPGAPATGSLMAQRLRVAQPRSRRPLKKTRAKLTKAKSKGRSSKKKRPKRKQ
jgi:Rv2525c-like, glycoside hydrolase-like domain